jgi:hypothetical protein
MAALGPVAGDDDDGAGDDLEAEAAAPAPSRPAARRTGQRRVAPHLAGYAESEPPVPAARAARGRRGVRVPFAPNPARIAIGVVIVGLGLFLRFVYVPSKHPWVEVYNDHGTLVDTDRPKNTFEWRFTADRYRDAETLAIAIAIAGLVSIGAGFAFRPRAEVKCRRCRLYVVAEKDGILLKCPRGRHTAGLGLGTLTLLFLAGGLAIAMVAIVAVGSITHAGG